MATDAPLVPLPGNLNVVYDRDTMIIRRKWFSFMAVFLAFFALFWNGFMIVWMTMAISSGVWIMAAFGCIHAAVGICMAYFAVASFVNKTDISVDPNYLKVRHYPLPWKGATEIRVHSIKQLYCKEKISRSKNGVNVTYQVNVITEDNREQKLLSGLQDSSQAHYIEKEIEAVLGIQNQAVSGEFR